MRFAVESSEQAPLGAVQSWDPFEWLSARFIGITAQLVPTHLQSLVFSSPLSARSTDLYLIWHPGYRQQCAGRIYLGLCYALLKGFLKGVSKLIFNPTTQGYALYGRIKNSLLVVSSVCGEESRDARFQTPYIRTAEDDALFVFGSLRELGARAIPCRRLRTLFQLAACLKLLQAGIRAGIRADGPVIDRLILLGHWVAWVTALDWRSLLLLEDSLAHVLEMNQVTKLGCIHEMHAYARIVWRLAARFGAMAYTLQHAAITRGKRWYFAYPEEQKAGLKLSDVFYVYDERTVSLLRPWFPETRFLLGCSPRYAKWVTCRPTPPPAGGCVLFAGGLANFDNEVLVNALKVLSRGGLGPGRVKLRLHPQAQLKAGQKWWLSRLKAKGLVTLSEEADLAKDLSEAKVVIGMSSTVLEEALLAGRPVIQLCDDKYLLFVDLKGVQGVKRVHWGELKLETISSCTAPDAAQIARGWLGLTHPVVTYHRLFEAEQTQDHDVVGCYSQPEPTR